MNSFLNPYNFISFPTTKAPAPKREDSVTGVITYEIKPLTPMIIPNSSNDNAFDAKEADHKTYDFFSYTDLSNKKDTTGECHEPVIPGSELRGVIRNIYETLTDSCMGIFNDDVDLSRRITEYFKPGVIRKLGEDKYILLSAEDAIYKERENRKSYLSKSIHEGQLFFINKKEPTANKREKNVYYNDECFKSSDAKHREYGFIIKGADDGSVGRKSNAHLFIPGDKLCDLNSNDLKNLEKTIKIYQANDSMRYSEYLEWFKKFKAIQKNNVFFPVYYSMLNNNKDWIYLSPACITRETYKTTLSSLAGDFNSCSGKEDCLCPACSLFGMVNKNKSIASRIRISDAMVKEECKQTDASNYYEFNGSPVTIQNLGGPKLANVEFYLQKPNGARFWTYDYYVTNDNQIRIEEGKLRGRKYYWHNQSPKLERNIEPSNQNKTVRLLKGKGGPLFVGKLFFDGISTSELKKLCWILNGGSEEEQQLNIAYKIGMGKPLGFGSIKCKLTDCHIRTLSLEAGNLEYKNEVDTSPVGSYEEVGFCPEVKKEFEIISNFTTIPVEKSNIISYPLSEDQVGKEIKEGFKWFTNNHSYGMNLSRKDYQLYKELPRISDSLERMLLPCNKKPEPHRNRNNDRNGYNRNRNGYGRR